eukprot:195151-Prymnesium_polylepis.1
MFVRTCARGRAAQVCVRGAHLPAILGQPVGLRDQLRRVLDRPQLECQRRRRQRLCLRRRRRRRWRCVGARMR